MSSRHEVLEQLGTNGGTPKHIVALLKQNESGSSEMTKIETGTKRTYFKEAEIFNLESLRRPVDSQFSVEKFFERTIIFQDLHLP